LAHFAEQEFHVLVFFRGQFFAELLLQPRRQTPSQTTEMVASPLFHFEGDLVEISYGGVLGYSDAFEEPGLQ